MNPPTRPDSQLKHHFLHFLLFVYIQDLVVVVVIINNNVMVAAVEGETR